MPFALALTVGLVFGTGLLLSGMANPVNVIGFLDVAGNWNPSLAFVMGGAILVAAPAFAWARRHPHALTGAPVELPLGRPVTRRLVLGSAVFGIGWGLAGLCPGPALVLLGQGGDSLLYAVLFTVSMAAGLWLAARLGKTPPGPAG